jgi:hypothetical protein
MIDKLSAGLLISGIIVLCYHWHRPLGHHSSVRTHNNHSREETRHVGSKHTTHIKYKHIVQNLIANNFCFFYFEDDSGYWLLGFRGLITHITIKIFNYVNYKQSFFKGEILPLNI